MAKDCEGCDVFGCDMRLTDCISWCQCEREWNRIMLGAPRPRCDENCNCQVALDDRTRYDRMDRCIKEQEHEQKAALAPKEWEVDMMWGWANTPNNKLYEGTFTFDAVYQDDAVDKARRKYPKVKILECRLATKEKEVVT